MGGRFRQHHFSLLLLTIVLINRISDVVTQNTTIPYEGSTPGAQDTVTTPDSDNDEATDSTTTTTMIDLLALARNSITALFNNAANPTRLAMPAGGISINDAIGAAEASLNTYKNSAVNQDQGSALTQMIGFAKGLNLMTPYFTDLSMKTPLSSAMATADLPSMNNTIYNFGIGDAKYMGILDTLMRLLVNAAQGLTTPPANTVTDGPDSSTTITPAATDSNTASITDNSTDSVSALTATTAITDDGTDSMSASTTTTTSDGSSNSTDTSGSNSTDAFFDWLNSNPSLSSEVRQMLINAWLARNNQSSTTPVPDTSGNSGGTGEISGETCKQARITQNDISLGFVRTDSTTGMQTWTVFPPRPDAINYIVRLRSILVQTSQTNIISVTIIPHTKLDYNQGISLNYSTGQVNEVINVVANDYSKNIAFVFVILSPSNIYSSIDSSQITVLVDYCYIPRGVNPAPGTNAIPWDHVQNILNNFLNQQSGYSNGFTGQVQPTPPTNLLGPGGMQLPSSSATSCSQSQILSVRSDSAGVVAQGNTWTINLLQIYSSAMIITFIRVNAQSQQVSGTIPLMFFDANRQSYGPYVFAQENANSLIFQNVPSTPISLVVIQFPPSMQTSTSVVTIAVCQQTNVLPVTDNLHLLQQLLGPQPQPVPGQNIGNTNQGVSVSGNGATPDQQGQLWSGNGVDPGQQGQVWSGNGVDPGQQGQVWSGNGVDPGQQGQVGSGNAVNPGQQGQVGSGNSVDQSSGTNENGRAIAPNPGSNLPNPYGQNGNQQWYVSGQNFNPQPFGFNQNPNFQQVPFGQNVYSQYGAAQPLRLLVMRYSDVEIPCTLHIIRAGSRLIVANTNNGQRVTWILQVPSRPGYMAVPNCISVSKCSFSQVSVNYLNNDQSPALTSNGTSLQFVSLPNMTDIGSFPAHVSAQKLQVDIDGAPLPLPPPSLEVHVIICYELTSPPQQPSPQQPFPQQPSPQQPSLQQPFLQQPFLQQPSPQQPFPQQPFPQQPFPQQPLPQQPFPQQTFPQQPFPQKPFPQQPFPQQPFPQQTFPQQPFPQQPFPQQPFPQQPQQTPPPYEQPQVQPAKAGKPYQPGQSARTPGMQMPQAIGMTAAPTPPTNGGPNTPTMTGALSYCSCTCQCPLGAPMPQISGATVTYQGLLGSPQQQQQQFSRRRRR